MAVRGWSIVAALMDELGIDEPMVLRVAEGTEEIAFFLQELSDRGQLFRINNGS